MQAEHLGGDQYSCWVPPRGRARLYGKVAKQHCSYPEYAASMAVLLVSGDGGGTEYCRLVPVVPPQW